MPQCCWLLAALLFFGAPALRADQTTATVQRALKDQGFYYGEANGVKNADTIAALRRYQIRNGLQITGQVDAETLRSLGIGGVAPPARANPPPSSPAVSDDEGQSAEIPDAREPAQAAPPRSPNGVYAPGARSYPAETSGFFAGTPYEMAPPDLQRHVLAGAQALLARAGFYRSGVDGEFGPATAAALRAYQGTMGLPADGRLNMETLSALRLLPGQRTPRIQSRRRLLLPRPVYRGQWIPE